MSKDFVEKMAKYLSFLHRERDVWNHETGWTETVKLFDDKIETVRDICSMFGVRAEVWKQAKTIYDWESGDAT